MTAKVDLELVGEIAIIRFSNPDNGYMTDDTSAGLLDALDRIETDNAIRVAILTGVDIRIAGNRAWAVGRKTVAGEPFGVVLEYDVGLGRFVPDPAAPSFPSPSSRS